MLNNIENIITGECEELLKENLKAVEALNINMSNTKTLKEFVKRDVDLFKKYNKNKSDDDDDE